MTIGFDLDHDLDLDFSRSNMEFVISQPKIVWLPRNKKQTYGVNLRAQIYQIVTSVVGVPSTHLVIFCCCLKIMVDLTFSTFTITVLFLNAEYIMFCGRILIAFSMTYIHISSLPQSQMHFFLRFLFKFAHNVYWDKHHDKFDYLGSSLNMCITHFD